MFEGCFFKTCDDRPLSAVLPICILVLLFISAELLVANCFVDSWYLSRLYAFIIVGVFCGLFLLVSDFTHKIKLDLITLWLCPPLGYYM